MVATMKSRGFTLIELLVVIAMLGILIAAVLMGMNTAKRKAFDSAALSCARQIRSAQTQFQTRNNTYASYNNLDAGTIRPCQFLTSAPLGTTSDAAYQFEIRHPKGSRTYLISETELPPP